MRIIEVLPAKLLSGQINISMSRQNTTFFPDCVCLANIPPIVSPLVTSVYAHLGILTCALEVAPIVPLLTLGVHVGLVHTHL